MDRRTLVVFLVALAACAVVTKPRPISWNDRSRFATIESIVDRGTVAIDGSPFAVGLGDEYRYRGHLYSDKSPLLAVQGAAVAKAASAFGVTLQRTPGAAAYVIVLGTAGLWFALGCAYAYAFQRLLGITPRGAAVVAAISGLGTLTLPYATVLANHVPAGAAALAAIYHYARGRDRRADAALGGVFAALAFAFDPPAAIVVLAAVPLLFRGPADRWGAVLAGFLPIVLAQVAFNHTVSAGFGPPALDPVSWSDPSSPFHARANEPLTYFDTPRAFLAYAAYVLVGGKGLFSYTPVALVCAYGLGVMWRTPGTWRTVALAVALPVVAYTVLVIVLTNDYLSGNFGERRYVDVFFTLCVALGPALAAVRGRSAALAVRAAVALSIVVAAFGTVQPFGGAAGEDGYRFGAEAFAGLASRAPLQAGLDVVAVVLTVAAVLRALPASWTSAAPTPRGSGRFA